MAPMSWAAVVSVAGQEAGHRRADGDVGRGLVDMAFQALELVLQKPNQVGPPQVADQPHLQGEPEVLAQGVARRPVDGFGQGLGKHRQALLHQGHQDGVLAGEVLVQRADRDPRPLGHGVGVEPGQAAGFENVSRRRHDRLDGRPGPQLRRLFPRRHNNL
jgi:hypothetical protein